MPRILLRIKFHGFGSDTDRKILTDTDTDSDLVFADRIGHGSQNLSIRTPLLIRDPTCSTVLYYSIISMLNLCICYMNSTVTLAATRINLFLISPFLLNYSSFCQYEINNVHLTSCLILLCSQQRVLCTYFVSQYNFFECPFLSWQTLFIFHHQFLGQIIKIPRVSLLQKIL